MSHSLSHIKIQNLFTGFQLFTVIFIRGISETADGKISAQSHTILLYVHHCYTVEILPSWFW